MTVQFLSGGRLTVSGEMVASGTPTQPITFTGVVTTPGSWSGILGYNPATTPARITLNYVTLEYGGISSYYGAQVYADNSYLTMTHSLVRSGAGSGIYHEGDAAIVVHGTHFEDNANDAVRIVSAARGLDLGGLTAAGNGRDVVHIASTSYLSGRQHLPAPGLPYMIDAVIGNQAGDSLTIDPGNELQFSSSGYLNIGGELKLSACRVSRSRSPGRPKRREPGSAWSSTAGRLQPTPSWNTPRSNTGAATPTAPTSA